jgi:ComF family protein
VLDALLALVYPERCAACDALLLEGPGLCDACAESLYPLGAACLVCAEPFGRAEAAVCGACRAAPPPYARVHAPWRYGGELAVALRRFKYGGSRGAGRLDLARPLGRLFRPAMRRALACSQAELVAPVPLHPRRLRARGFSQAQALAEAALPGELARLDVFALSRRRDTREQAGLPRAERRRNVAGAFLAAARVAGRRVLLVDDVVTTGATAAEAARALLEAGAARVEVLALARAEA